MISQLLGNPSLFYSARDQLERNPALSLDTAFEHEVERQGIRRRVYLLEKHAVNEASRYFSQLDKWMTPGHQGHDLSLHILCQGFGIKIGADELRAFTKRPPTISAQILNPHRFVLLTGAGFSYPFGGLLAKEFWDALFRRPEVQGNPKLRSLILSNRQFEDALAVARTSGEYTAIDVSGFENAVLSVFRAMDTDISSNHTWRDGALNVYKFQDFLKRFQCHRQDGSANASFLFTLNQDFTVERHWYNFNHWAFPPHLPGVPTSMRMNSAGKSWFSTHSPEVHDDIMEVTIPDEPLIELASSTNYVKLHGSINWRKADGSRALVIGSQKDKQVRDMPLLNSYGELFSQVLSKRIRLMVVGYSFQDEHINLHISRACLKHGLDLHIWDKFASDILDRITSRDDCAGIADRVSGVWTRPMQDVWPADQSESTLWREMQESFFGS